MTGASLAVHVPEELEAEHVSTKSEELNTTEIVKLLLCFAPLCYCAAISLLNEPWHVIPNNMQF